MAQVSKTCTKIKYLRVIPFALLGVTAFSFPAKAEFNLGMTGTFRSRIEAVLAGPESETCDGMNAARMMEVASVLDAKAAEIKYYSEHLPPEADENWRSERFGPINILKRLTPPSPVKGWTSRKPKSWEKIWATFKRRENPTTEDLYNLNERALAILVDDYDRVVNGINYLLEPAMLPDITEMHSALKLCLAKQDCIFPFLSDELRGLATSQPPYSQLFEALVKAPNFADRRTKLKEVMDRAEKDMGRFSFFPNPNVKQIAPGIFELTMDPGDFSSVATRIADYVEAAWSDSNHRVIVKWSQRENNPGLYKFIAGTAVAERPYVDHQFKEIYLFPDSPDRAIAHEVGHVLGFPDVYYNVWNPVDCSYTFKAFSESLMGDGDNGSVLAEHWRELDKNYPYRAR